MSLAGTTSHFYYNRRYPIPAALKSVSTFHPAKLQRTPISLLVGFLSFRKREIHETENF